MEEITTCEGCAACCEIMLIRFKGCLPKDYAEARGIKVIGGRFIAFKHICPYLKEGKCAIYESRPRMCGAFPIGGIDCMACREIKSKF